MRIGEVLLFQMSQGRSEARGANLQRTKKVEGRKWRVGLSLLCAACIDAAAPLSAVAPPSPDLRPLLPPPSSLRPFRRPLIWGSRGGTTWGGQSSTPVTENKICDCACACNFEYEKLYWRTLYCYSIRPIVQNKFSIFFLLYLWTCSNGCF